MYIKNDENVPNRDLYSQCVPTDQFVGNNENMRIITLEVILLFDPRTLITVQLTSTSLYDLSYTALQKRPDSLLMKLDIYKIKTFHVNVQCT